MTLCECRRERDYSCYALALRAGLRPFSRISDARVEPSLFNVSKALIKTSCPAPDKNKRLPLGAFVLCGGERSLSSIPTLRDICASMHFRILTTYFSSRVRIRTSTRQSIRAPCGAFLFVWRRERSLRTSLCSRDTCTSMCIGIHTFYRYIEGSNPLLAIHKKGACKPLFYGWRRGRDSNPRYGVTVYTLSRRAPSAARTPLQKFAEYPLLSLATGAVRKRGARLNQMRLECNSGSDQPV